MKFAADRPYANPEAAARNLIEIANSVEDIKLINGLFLYADRVTIGARV